MIIKQQIQNITDELVKLQSLFEAISSVLPDRHFVVDQHGVVIACLGNTVREFFYNHEEIEGKCVTEMCEPEVAKLIIDGISRTLESGELTTLEYSIELSELRQRIPDIAGPKGVQWFELKLVPLDENVTGCPSIVCSSRNVTKRKMMELELKVMAQTDPLTGLYNRRYVMSELGHAFSRNQRYETSTAVLMLDIDFFKQINDTFGHDAGDMVLTEFSKYLQTALRDLDVVGRFGGEEFLVIMPESTIEQAAPVAERLLEGVRDLTVVVDDAAVSFTVSGGLSEIRSEDENVNEVLKRSDLALYSSKESGRDRVHIA